MKKEYLPIVDLIKRFSGADQGFRFLNSFLDKITKKKNKEGIRIYDYRIDSHINVELNNLELYDLVQQCYIDFLLQEKFCNYEWFIRFKNVMYILFNKPLNQPDLFSDTLILIFIRAFLLLSNKNNLIDLILFKKIIITSLISLSSDEIESNKYFDFILENLKNKNLIILEKNFISINDRFIYYEFSVTSLDIAFFFSDHDFDIKYNCQFNFESLLSVIDYYLSSLVYDNSYNHCYDLFSLNPKYSECFPFLMNYNDIDFTKIPILINPYDQLFDAFLIKKLILNEYCFHTIIMSCFDYYIYNSKIKNILMEKADPKLKFKIDTHHIFIK